MSHNLGIDTTGRINFEHLESTTLKKNPLGDSNIREAIVYTPPGYNPDESYPVVYCLPGFTETGRSLVSSPLPLKPITSKMDLLIQRKECGKMILVIVDCFNRLGGSQYINSIAVGNYEDYVIKELIPFVEHKYKCGKRALLGGSSGGYGAFVLGMKYPDLFSGLVIHAGDCGFEYCYRPFLPRAWVEIRRVSGVASWLDKFWEKEKKPNGKATDEEEIALGILCFAAHYSPDQSSERQIGLPFSLDTGELDYAVWEKWLEHDPSGSSTRIGGRSRIMS